MILFLATFTMYFELKQIFMVNLYEHMEELYFIFWTYNWPVDHRCLNKKIYLILYRDTKKYFKALKIIK